MAQEVGVAYYSLLPTTKGFGKAVEKELNSAADGHEKSQKSLWSNVTKYGAIAAGAIGALFTAKIIQGGLSRALNIEDAQAKLKGLGHDTQSVSAIMQDALAAVRGTAFGLDSAATIAASAVAAGVKPGQQLERYLKLTADAATIAGSSLDEMGSILNKVQGSGKAYNDSLQQLADRGIPIYQWLAEELGTTTDAVFKLASQGKISSEQFQAAIEKNIAGAALASGDTTRGAFANMMAAMSRWGASLLTGVLPFAKTFFSEMITVFDGLNERSKPFLEKFNEWLNGLNIEGAGQRFLDWLDGLDFSKFAEAVGYLTPLIAVARELGPLLWSTLGPALKELTAALAPVLPQVAQALAEAVVELAPSLVDLLRAVIPLIPPLVELAVSALPLVVDALKLAIPVVEWLAGDLTALLTAFSGVISLLKGDITPQGFLDLAESLGEANWNFQTLLDRAKFFQSWISTGLNNAVAVFEGVRSAVGRVVDAISGAWEFLGASVGDAMRIYAGFFTGNSDLISEGVGRLRDRLSGIWESIRSTATGAASGLWDRVRGIFRDGAEWVASIPVRILDVFKTLPLRMATLGQQIVQGLIDGIVSKVQQAVIAMHNLGSNMLDGIKSWLQIKSPSRVFRDEVGKQIAAGVIAGVDGMRVQTDTAMQALVNVPSIGTTTAAGERPVFMDGSIVAILRELASGEAQLVFNEQILSARTAVLGRG